MESKLKIASMKTGNMLRLQLAGEVNTNTAQELEACMEENLAEKEDPVEVKYLDIDCKGLTFISSAGLRVLFRAAKTINTRGGNIVLRNPKPEICRVFGMTGISRLVEIENFEEDLGK